MSEGEIKINKSNLDKNKETNKTLSELSKVSDSTMMKDVNSQVLRDMTQGKTVDISEPFQSEELNRDGSKTVKQSVGIVTSHKQGDETVRSETIHSNTKKGLRDEPDIRDFSAKLRDGIDSVVYGAMNKAGIESKHAMSTDSIGGGLSSLGKDIKAGFTSVTNKASDNIKGSAIKAVKIANRLRNSFNDKVNKFAESSRDEATNRVAATVSGLRDGLNKINGLTKSGQKKINDMRDENSVKQKSNQSSRTKPGSGRGGR